MAFQTRAKYGRSGLFGILLGSVTNKVLTHTKTPVLVCHLRQAFFYRLEMRSDRAPRGDNRWRIVQRTLTCGKCCFCQHQPLHVEAWLKSPQKGLALTRACALIFLLVGKIKSAQIQSPVAKRAMTTMIATCIAPCMATTRT